MFGALVESDDIEGALLIDTQQARRSAPHTSHPLPTQPLQQLPFYGVQPQFGCCWRAYDPLPCPCPCPVRRRMLYVARSAPALASTPPSAAAGVNGSPRVGYRHSSPSTRVRRVVRAPEHGVQVTPGSPRAPMPESFTPPVPRAQGGDARREARPCRPTRPDATVSQVRCACPPNDGARGQIVFS